MKARFSTKRDSLGSALEAVDEFCKEESLTSEDCNKLRLVCEELFANIFSHAAREGTTFMEVELLREKDTICVNISYDGALFDPTSYTDERMYQEPTERKEGGWGIFLVKSFADRFTYERTGEENRLRLELKPRGRHKTAP